MAVVAGVNRVDPDAYDGAWDGAPLCGAERDASKFAELLRRFGIPSTPLLGSAVTRDHILQALSDAITRATSGDLVVFYFAGHGGYLHDRNADEGADGPTDETLCAHDGMLVDDELRMIWGSASPGVRILTCIDSCHSGTAYKLAGASGQMEAGITRAMPSVAIERTYARHRVFYDDIQRRTISPPPLAASLLHVGACGDQEETLEYNCGGTLTKLILAATPRARTYAQLEREVERFRPRPPPVFRYEGPGAQDFATTRLFQ